MEAKQDRQLPYKRVILPGSQYQSQYQTGFEIQDQRSMESEEQEADSAKRDHHKVLSVDRYITRHGLVNAYARIGKHMRDLGFVEGIDEMAYVEEAYRALSDSVERWWDDREHDGITDTEADVGDGHNGDSDIDSQASYSSDINPDDKPEASDAGSSVTDEDECEEGAGDIDADSEITVPRADEDEDQPQAISVRRASRSCRKHAVIEDSDGEEGGSNKKVKKGEDVAYCAESEEEEPVDL